MQKIRVNQLTEPVRSFLAQVGKGEGLIIEDEAGRAQFGVIAYQEATAAERDAAWNRLQALQRKVGEAMQEQGIAEEDIDRALQADD